MLSSDQQQKAIGALLQRKENELCADCNSKNPCWASLDFGVFVCMNCAGAHRALGQSVTRVKSTKLDTWHRDWLENMRIGNAILNQYWEKQLTRSACSSSLLSQFRKPNPNTPLQDIIAYVQEKYVQRRFADKKQAQDPLKRPKNKVNDQYQKIQTQPKSQQSKIQKKETLLTHKAATHSPFQAFDTIIAKKLNTQKKVSENLISFDFEHKKCEEEKIAKRRQNPPSQVQVVKNHSQFHTFSGTKAKVQNDLFANFDNFIKSKDTQHTFLNPKDNPQGKQQANKAQHNAKVHATNLNHHTANVINKNQYSTMNHLNMHAHNTPFTTNNNHHDHLLKNNSNLAGHNHQFLTHNQHLIQNHARNNINITLDANIDLTVGSKQQKKERSWIDEWK